MQANNLYLNFSDSAKYADIARNVFFDLGYGGSFSFWAVKIFDIIKENIFPFGSVPPVMPYSIAGFFKIFGVTDFAVIATSFFYFLLTLIFTYLLANVIFKSKLVGALSTLAIGTSHDLIHYAVNGASESPFIFEIVAASYFASLKKKWASVLTVLLLILMYFTRPQAFIYIAGIILFWLITNFKLKKALIVFAGVLVAGLLVDQFILLPLNGKYFLYSIVGRSVGFSFNQSSNASDALRGATEIASVGLVQISKNIFYNLYNFYKALPEIINPYFFTLFAIGLFIKSPSTSLRISEEKGFKVASIFMAILTLIVTAASIPFYRYIHPVLPLVYIIAVGTLVKILNLGLMDGGLEKRRQKFTILISIVLILLFGVGQTVGKFVLDSRFEAKRNNVGKPPVYVELSKILRENTSPDDVVVTNLDTWGSWYGERKTIWFPLTPKQLIDSSTGKIPFDVIYLTSYKIDDTNYYMGEDWRMIFDNPKDPSKWKCGGCSEITKLFKLKGVYEISSDSNFENESSYAVLLAR